ncbi:PAAR domain-containing protein [Morganella psychrotolerans]|uniref:PAAR domain-containing protein n=2 Tax=Morganella psychrotolerans TaxID=368603 RepID=A0A5M9R6F6_9GAMM|nr:PAAR domain-containing protein [Morganella psychrotolerans]KAA8715506.1 PAAR domain-containing protein [Morganella psychrotolerans]
MFGLRPIIMGKEMALNGDKTTTGATCIATIETVSCFNKKALRVGDPTTKCPECGQAGVVVSGQQGFLNHGKLQAVHDSIVECGCPDGTNKVIAYSDPENAQSSSLTTQSPAFSTSSQNSSKSQFVPATAPPLTDESKSSDNILYEGVFVWTETHGSGHSFITIHKNNQVSLYSYGRYGTPGPLTLTGDGIMLYMTGEDAGKYIKDNLYILNSRVFKITDADIDKTKMYFNNLWNSGATPEFPEYVDKLIRRNGRSIDVYDVTGNNCTTHIVKGLKQSGTKIFEETYTPIRTQYPIEREEAFTVPVSLQNYLDRKKHNLKKPDLIEITEEFMREYPNNENLMPSEKGIKAQIFELITFSGRIGGEVTSVDGGEMGGGILGSSYDQ